MIFQIKIFFRTLLLGNMKKFHFHPTMNVCMCKQNPIVIANRYSDSKNRFSCDQDQYISIYSKGNKNMIEKILMILKY